MPHLDSHQSEAQFRSLFEKLMLMEAKLDKLICLQRQEQELRVHPPLRAEYLDIIDVSKLLKVEQKTFITGSPLGRSPTSRLMVACSF